LSISVIKECNDAEVVCISIVDTNMTRFANINLAIPGNEASIDSVLFYNNIISKKILFEKYFLIIN
jgi:ribosomal protein S2